MASKGPCQPKQFCDSVNPGRRAFTSHRSIPPQLLRSDETRGPSAFLLLTGAFSSSTLSTIKSGHTLKPETRGREGINAC